MNVLFKKFSDRSWSEDFNPWNPYKINIFESRWVFAKPFNSVESCDQSNGDDVTNAHHPDDKKTKHADSIGLVALFDDGGLNNQHCNVVVVVEKVVEENGVAKHFNQIKKYANNRDYCKGKFSGFVYCFVILKNKIAKCFIF